MYEIMYLFFWMCYSIRLTWRISRKLNNVASIWLKIINTHVIIILFWTRQHILYCFVLYRHSQKSQIYTIFLDIGTVLVHNCVFSPLKSRVYATFPSSIFHWSNSVTVYPHLITNPAGQWKILQVIACDFPSFSNQSF